jgi:hypothetical protein
MVALLTDPELLFLSALPSLESGNSSSKGGVVDGLGACGVVVRGMMEALLRAPASSRTRSRSGTRIGFEQ